MKYDVRPGGNGRLIMGYVTLQPCRFGEEIADVPTGADDMEVFLAMTQIDEFVKSCKMRM